MRNRYAARASCRAQGKGYWGARPAGGRRGVRMAKRGRERNEERASEPESESGEGRAVGRKDKGKRLDRSNRRRREGCREKGGSYARCERANARAPSLRVCRTIWYRCVSTVNRKEGVSRARQRRESRTRRTRTEEVRAACSTEVSAWTARGKGGELDAPCKYRRTFSGGLAPRLSLSFFICRANRTVSLGLLPQTY